jgi:hypothetical protein
MLTNVGILNYYTLQIRRKVCTTVSIMWENARFYIFAKIFDIFVHFRKKIFAKSEKKFSRKFRENAKTKIFVSTLSKGFIQVMVSRHYGSVVTHPKSFRTNFQPQHNQYRHVRLFCQMPFISSGLA